MTLYLQCLYHLPLHHNDVIPVIYVEKESMFTVQEDPLQTNYKCLRAPHTPEGTPPPFTMATDKVGSY